MDAVMRVSAALLAGYDCDLDLGRRCSTIGGFLRPLSTEEPPRHNSAGGGSVAAGMFLKVSPTTAVLVSSSDNNPWRPETPGVVCGRGVPPRSKMRSGTAPDDHEIGPEGPCLHPLGDLAAARERDESAGRL